MKPRIDLILSTATACLLIGAAAFAEQDINIQATSSLWYNTPGSRLSDGLPLGNGRMGMIVLGDPAREVIILNEESMWSGSRDDQSNRPEAHKALPAIRQLLLDGRNHDAEKLINQTFTCAGGGNGEGKGANRPFGCYQVFGNLLLASPLDGEVTDYRRVLDLRDAVASVSFKRDEVQFRREMFVSAPDQVGMIRLTSDKPASIHFEVGMARPERFETDIVEGDLLMRGSLSDGRGGEGVSFAGCVRVLNKGGRMTVGENSISIDGADEVVLFVAAETTYDGNVPRERKVVDAVAKTLEVVEAAAAKSYEVLRETHVAEHRSWYDRSVLTMGVHAGDGALKPTNQRLFDAQKGRRDPALVALYYNFGRYLLIASSRPGTLPANLQGIWAEENTDPRIGNSVQTPWNGDWHLNINVQMNYWLAEVAGLSECHTPLLRLVESLQEPGSATAKAYYDAPGWVVHHTTNPWGFTAPGRMASYGSFALDGAWLCAHLWEHYMFTGDREYLARIYPVMRESARFHLASLIEEPRNKWLVTAPSNSPENHFLLPDGSKAAVCMGPTMDMQLLRELFGNCITASEILDADHALRGELRMARSRLAPNQIGPDGRLQEWLEPYEEPAPGHRHVSHLYGLHPGHEISIDETPALAEAARKSLDRRGDGGTGWSLAWKVNFHARLRDGNRAEKLLRSLMSVGRGSGSYPNLLCAHPPFQIDGNFGGAAGIAEMLIQSRWSGRSTEPAVIHLLPALPDAWPDGEVTGLRARGGFIVDMKWRGSALVEATVKSIFGNRGQVLYRERSWTLDLAEGQRKVLSN